LGGECVTEYEVKFRATIHETVRVQAENPEEAHKLACEGIRGGDRLGQAWRAEWVEDIAEDECFEALGTCEFCGAVLLVGRDEGRSAGEDAGDLCTPCYAKAIDEAGAGEVPA
jgi:hypothetical protein